MKYFSTFSGIGGFELGIGDRTICNSSLNTRQSKEKTEW
mgnify:CR=1 FL=1